MKPEPQRIAIAEACGWHTIAFNSGWVKVGDGETQAMIPDYLNDLNAMREAEVTLMDRPEAWGNYCIFLRRNFVRPDSAIGATASQRAEAFLRTLDLWEP